MRVFWTYTAREHLQAIHDDIAQTSPQYAKRTVDRLTQRSQQIGDFPLSGRAVPEARHGQIREVVEGPYRILYYVMPNRIDVLAVVHGAQQTPWRA